MSDHDSSDPVVGTQPVMCPGRAFPKDQDWRGRNRYSFLHVDNVSAVMMVHRSGRARIACPTCGTYDVDEDV
jgi:hypothetical protein